MEPYRLGIIDALSAMAAGALTKRDYLESCIARAQAVEPYVHAFAHLDVQTLRAIGDEARGPLAGIPIGIKDIISTKGVPTEMGSAAFRGHVPDQSAFVIEALAAAGAVMFGKTVTTEFAWRHPGPTRNPWNLDHSPGGSSSGSAAAVAYGAVPGALGTQTLGSVLRPAAFCGVVGYKPSYSAIPRSGVYGVAASLDHVGVFARSVADAALLASVLFGNDGVDFRGEAPLSSTWPLRAPTHPSRIALLRMSAWDRASGEQQRLVEAVADQLAAEGTTIVPLDLPPAFDAMWQTAAMICDVEGSKVNAALAAETPPRISRATLDLVARGRRVSETNYLRAKRNQRALIDAFAAIVAPFDAILTAPALGEAPDGLVDTGDAVYCTPASLLGAPAIAVPADRSANGLPLGVQLLGAWGRDLALLETAVWVERVIDWRPGFPSP
jgi:amidase